MKRLFLLFVFMLGGRLFSQDQLFKKDNSKHDVKVLEVTPDEIKYKLKANPNGPLYIVKKTEVALVIYENGTHETYPDAKPLIQTQTVTVYSHPYNYIDSNRIYRKRENESKFLEVTKKKNVAFINTLAVANSCISLSYFREFGKGYFSIQLPISFSFAQPVSNNFFNIYGSNVYYDNVSDYKITRKAFEGGLGLYFHTSGRRAVTHFIGPLLKLTQYNGTFKSYPFTIDQNGFPVYGPTPIEHGFVLNETSCYLNNGILFRITPELNLMMQAAIGFNIGYDYIGNDPFDYAYYRYGSSRSFSSQVFNIGFHFGYRF